MSSSDTTVARVLTRGVLAVALALALAAGCEAQPAPADSRTHAPTHPPVPTPTPTPTPTPVPVPTPQPTPTPTPTPTPPPPKPATLDDEVAALVKQLGDNDWDRREAAQKRLQEIGKPAVARLRAALASPDMEVSSRSKALLAEIVGQGFLGVQVRDPDAGDREGRDDIPAEGGTVIIETLQDTPASGAGLRPGDFLHSLDGRTIQGSGGLVEMVAPIEPGTTVKLVLYRNGKKEETLIKVGRRPKEVAR